MKRSELKQIIRKIVEEMVLYHGTVLHQTDPKFEKFEKRTGYRGNALIGNHEVTSEWFFVTDDQDLAKKYASPKWDDIISKTKDFKYKKVILNVDIDESKLKVLDLTTDDYEEVLEDKVGYSLYDEYGYYPPEQTQLWELLDSVEISNLIKSKGFDCVKLLEDLGSISGISYAIDIDKQHDVIRNITEDGR